MYEVSIAYICQSSAHRCLLLKPEILLNLRGFQRFISYWFEGSQPFRKPRLNKITCFRQVN